MKWVKVVAIVIAVLVMVGCIVGLSMVQAGSIDLPSPHGAIETVRWAC